MTMEDFSKQSDTLKATVCDHSYLEALEHAIEKMYTDTSKGFTFVQPKNYSFEGVKNLLYLLVWHPNDIGQSDITMLGNAINNNLLEFIDKHHLPETVIIIDTIQQVQSAHSLTSILKNSTKEKVIKNLKQTNQYTLKKINNNAIYQVEDTVKGCTHITSLHDKKIIQSGIFSIVKKTTFLGKELLLLQHKKYLNEATISAYLQTLEYTHQETTYGELIDKVLEHFDFDRLSVLTSNYDSFLQTDLSVHLNKEDINIPNEIREQYSEEELDNMINKHIESLKTISKLPIDLSMEEEVLDFIDRILTICKEYNLYQKSNAWYSINTNENSLQARSGSYLTIHTTMVKGTFGGNDIVKFIAEKEPGKFIIVITDFHGVYEELVIEGNSITEIQKMMPTFSYI